MSFQARVIYIAHARFPTERGHGQQIAKVCEALGRKAHVSLLVPVISRDDPFSYYGINQTFKVRHVPVASVKRSTRIGFIREKIEFLVRAARETKRHAPDLVITREPLLPLFWNGNAVLEVHHIPRTLRFYGLLLRRFVLIIAKTSYVAERLVQAGVSRTRIVVLPNAVDLASLRYEGSTEEARAYLGLPRDGNLVGYWGSLLAWKGVDVLLKAAAQIPRSTIVIAGGTPREVEEKQAQYREQNSIFLGHRPYADRAAFMAAMNTLVAPNAPGTDLSEKYTSPLKLYEYMASRKPIIASDLPSIRESVTERDVFFFMPGSVEDLARTILEVNENTEEAGARADHAYQSVQENTWDRYAERLLKEATTRSV